MPVTPATFKNCRALFESVLPGDGVNYEQGFVWRAFDFAPRDAFHLFEFGHQIRFVVEASGGVNDEHIGVARFGGLERVEEDCRRVGALFLLDKRDARSFSPDSELVGGGGAEGVGGADQNVVAFGLDALREFADGCRLAHSVDADDHHHVRRDVFRHARFGGDPLLGGGAEYCEQLIFDRGLERFNVVDLFARNAAPHAVENFQRRRHADVCRDQNFFEFVEQFGVNFLAALEDRVNPVGKRFARGGDGIFETLLERLFERGFRRPATLPSNGRGRGSSLRNSNATERVAAARRRAARGRA
jgi:hypothetical protein